MNKIQLQGCLHMEHQMDSNQGQHSHCIFTDPKQSHVKFNYLLSPNHTSSFDYKPNRRNYIAREAEPG